MTLRQPNIERMLQLGLTGMAEALEAATTNERAPAWRPGSTGACGASRSRNTGGVRSSTVGMAIKYRKKSGRVPYESGSNT